MSWDGPDGQSPLSPYSGTVSEEDAFVLKLDSEREYQWHTFIGSDGFDWGESLMFDSGTLFLYGDSIKSWDGPEASNSCNRSRGSGLRGHDVILTM